MTVQRAGEARSGYDALGIYLHLLPSSTYPKDPENKNKKPVADVVDRVSYRFKAINQFWDASDPTGLHRHFCRPVQVTSHATHRLCHGSV
jgi:hypothetical protein